jgi:hypothetical protein
LLIWMRREHHHALMFIWKVNTGCSPKLFSSIEFFITLNTRQVSTDSPCRRWNVY